MKCKVLLVGEGPCDIGDLAIEPTYREGREGFLQPRVGFAEIGEATTPATLEKACPDSFPPFARDVDRALQQRTATGRPPAGTRPRRAKRRSRQ